MDTVWLDKKTKQLILNESEALRMDRRGKIVEGMIIGDPSEGSFVGMDGRIRILKAGKVVHEFIG